MKLLLPFLLLLLSLLTPQAAHAQLDRIVFHCTSSRTILSDGRSMEIMSPIECLDIITLRHRLVQYKSTRADSVITFPVVTITGNTKQRLFYWECPDRTFLLNIGRGSLLVSYKQSLNTTTLVGTVELRNNTAKVGE